MNLTSRKFSGPCELHVAEGPAVGPALLLLHGVTRNGCEWNELLPELTRHWRVITLDARGHGESARAASYLLTDYIADTVRFVSGLRAPTTEPLVILGHSMGAMVAAAVAAECPKIVRGIVLEDPPFHTMGQRIRGSAWMPQFTGMRDAARRGGSIEQLADAIAEIQIPAAGGTFKRLGELRDRASLLWSAECLSHLDPEVLTPVIEGRWLDGYDLAQILPRIQCPTLLLQADTAAGGALTDSDAEKMVAAMPSCRRIKFPGVSHQIHRTVPEAVLRTLNDFGNALPWIQ